MNNLKYRSFKAALGGIIAALSVALMFSTGIVPWLTYAVPAVSGALLMMLVIEISPAFALTVYAAVAVLSLLLVADKEAAVMYAAFFGYYPVIKSLLEKKLSKIPLWIVKFLIFNASVIAAYFIVTYALKLPFDDMGMFGKYTVYVLLASANVVFVLYDVALTRLVTLYYMLWRKYVRRLFK